ncbi:isocitrate lyase, partial [Nocardia sp. NPDC003345]
MSTTGTPKTPEEIQKDWDTNPRWKGVTRNYTAEQVSKLQGTVVEEHTLARRGSEILWDLVNNEDYINSLGALTGNMAVQQVRAGLKAIYLSGPRLSGLAGPPGPYGLHR